MPDEISIVQLANTIVENYAAHTTRHVFTVAISGIDASGKGHISKLLEDELKRRGLRVANINIDPWQYPLPVRLKQDNAAENFYHNVFRWDDILDLLIIPLRMNGRIDLHTTLIRTHCDERYKCHYHYDNVDIILFEGIFLLQERFLKHYDYKIWIECSFETAMKRAIQRNVEKLNEDQLAGDYNTYYYPAQRLHFEKDDPFNKADLVFHNE